MKVVWYNIKVQKVLYFIQFEDRDEDYVALNWNKQWSKSFLVMFLMSQGTAFASMGGENLQFLQKGR